MTALRFVADLLAAGCLLAGGLLNLAGGIGVLRLPDVLSRVHAVAKPQVLGALLILTGVALRVPDAARLGNVVLIGLFQLVTTPVSAQMISRAAYRVGMVRRDLLDLDELAPAEPRRPS